MRIIYLRFIYHFHSHLHDSLHVHEHHHFILLHSTQRGSCVTLLRSFTGSIHLCLSMYHHGLRPLNLRFTMLRRPIPVPQHVRPRLLIHEFHQHHYTSHCFLHIMIPSIFPHRRHTSSDSALQLPLRTRQTMVIKIHRISVGLIQPSRSVYTRARRIL